MKAQLLISFLVIIIAGFQPNSAMACRFEPRPIWDSYASASAIFVGKIIYAELGKDGGASGDILVEKVLKGAYVPDTSLPLLSRQTSCGERFAEHERWLIMGTATPFGINISMPTGSLLLTDAEGKENCQAWQVAAELLSASQHAIIPTSCKTNKK